MFDYLVTSRVRRRLLELLWARGVTGSASELAGHAGVAFAGAYRELKEMHRQGLAAVVVEDGAERYRARLEHPEADLLRRLVNTRTRMRTGRDLDDHEILLRRRLRGLGVPLPVEPASVDADDLEQTLVAGVELARRDPTLATVLPVALWRWREGLDRGRLEQEARRAKQKHATGFMLALTAELSGDRRLARLSEQLRDGRVTQLRPFFTLPSTRSADRTMERRTPPVAREWGYRLDLDLDSLRTQFAKFSDDGAV